MVYTTVSMTQATSRPTRAYKPRPNARRASKALPHPAADGPPFRPEELAAGRIVQGDCLAQMRRLPDRTVDLVILDPPYWKVVGESWDYKWRTEDDYRVWCNEWLREVARVVKRSASVYLFGYLRNLVHLFHDVTALGFEFRQEIIVDKGLKCLAGRKTSTYKQFPNTTETIFFFVYDAKPAIREFLLGRAKVLGLSAKQINQRLNVKSNGGGVWSLYTGNNILAQVPTTEMWRRLDEVLECEAPDDLRGFVFNQEMGITNVWQDIDFYSEKRIHRTQKPIALIERLVLASSNVGQLVLDPFAGSGSTLVAARKHDRHCIGFEIDPTMVDRANARLAAVERQGELF